MAISSIFEGIGPLQNQNFKHTPPPPTCDFDRVLNPLFIYFFEPGHEYGVRGIPVFYWDHWIVLK